MKANELRSLYVHLWCIYKTLPEYVHKLASYQLAIKESHQNLDISRHTLKKDTINIYAHNTIE